MPAFGQSREDKINNLKELPKPKTLTNKETNTSSPTPVIINNNNKEDKKVKKEINKKAIPKKLRKGKYEQTEEQKLRIFKNYIQPQLLDNNTNDPNNDLVQSLKDVFGRDNKEELNQPLPTFTYENEMVRQKLANELFAENEIKRNEAILTIKNGLKEPLKRRKQQKEKENEASKVITRLMTKAKNAKDNDKIQLQLEAAKIYRRKTDDNAGLYVRPFENEDGKVVKLQYGVSPAKADKVKKKKDEAATKIQNAFRNKKAINEFAEKFIEKTTATKNSSTEPRRKRGRPKKNTLKIANMKAP